MAEEILLVKMRGLNGSGKSATAMAIGANIDGVILRSDEIRNRSENLDYILFTDEERAKFSNEELTKRREGFGPEELKRRKYALDAIERNYKCIINEIEQHILTGRSAIIDATNRKIRDLEATCELERKYRLRSCIVETVSNYSVAYSRMLKRNERAGKESVHNPSEADWKVRLSLLPQFETVQADIYIKTKDMLYILQEIYEEFFPWLKINAKRTPKSVGEDINQKISSYIDDPEALLVMREEVTIFYSALQLDWLRNGKLREGFRIMRT